MTKTKILGASLIVVFLAPQAAFAAQKSGTVKNWFLGKREVVLQDGTECRIAKDVDLKGVGVGKDVTLTYTGEGKPPVNTCTAVMVK